MPSGLDFNGVELSAFDMDYDIMKNDDQLLDHFNADLDVLLPEDESLQSKMSLDNDFLESLMQTDDNWGSSFPDLNADDFSCKLEPVTPSESPVNSGSESCSSESSSKFILETPPVSPPFPNADFIFVDPQVKNEPLENIKNQLAPLVNIKNIKIIGNLNNSKKEDKQKIVLPKTILRKVKADDARKLPISSRISYPTPIVPAKSVQSPKSSNSVFQTALPTAVSLPITLNLPSVKQENEPTTNKKNDLNIKALKRQQRMIKNRESACLSRKKKKEYVTGLEGRISELENENSRLKMENDALKARVKDLESREGSARQKPFLNSNLRKTTAVFAVFLMVSLNIGSLSYLSNVSPEFQRPSDVRRGRSLLWAPPDVEKPHNMSSNMKTRCPLYVNQTESLRLAEELNRWIAVDVGNGRYRNSSNQRPKKVMPRHFVLQSPQKVKFSKLFRSQRRVLNALDVYRSPFPESLPRRDDTFYVVSFSSDHLLIPAAAHNKTLRPKMSFLIPTIPLNGSNLTNGAIPMMQIDCEVLATKSVDFTRKDFQLLKPKEEVRKDFNSSEVVPPYKPYFLQKRRPKPPGTEYDKNFDSYLNRVYKAAFP